MIDAAHVPHPGKDKTPQTSRKGLLTVFLAAIAVFAAVTIYMTVEKERFFWDFSAYYYAGKTAAMGGDPYDVEAINRLKSGQTGVPGRIPGFIYSRLFLLIFMALSNLKYGAALGIYIAAKLFAVAVLIAAYMKILGRQVNPSVPWILLVGFGSSLLIDFGTGNISAFEQAFLYAGLLLYLREKRGWGIVLMLAAAMAKTILVFIPTMMVLLDIKRDRWLALATILSGAVLAAANYCAVPVRLIEDFGFNNPMYVIVRALFMKAAQASGTAPDWTPVAAKAVFFALCLAAGVMWFRKAAAMDPRGRALAVVLLYALVIPRLPDYSIVVAVAPFVYFAAESRFSRALLGLACLPSPVYFFKLNVFFMYLPYLLLLCVFLIFALGGRERKNGIKEPG